MGTLIEKFPDLTSERVSFIHALLYEETIPEEKNPYLELAREHEAQGPLKFIGFCLMSCGDLKVEGVPENYNQNPCWCFDGLSISALKKRVVSAHRNLKRATP